MSIWYNIELVPPRMQDSKDRREMAKFVAALAERLTDVYTYASGDTEKIRDADKDTIVNTEESTDEDIIRFDTNGTEAFVIDNSQDVEVKAGAFAIPTDEWIYFEGLTGDTKMKYNSTSNYIEVWVDNLKRVEL